MIHSVERWESNPAMKVQILFGSVVVIVLVRFGSTNFTVRVRFEFG